MSVNFNSNYLYSLNGIDSASVASVSSQILKNASANAQVKSIDYSKFNRATLGVDLYSNRTNVEVQKQISMMNAGLYAKAVNVAKLNASAAANLYSANQVQKQVELTQSTSANETLAPRATEDNDLGVKLFNIADKHSSSSNGFNPFAAGKEKENEKGE